MTERESIICLLLLFLWPLWIFLIICIFYKIRLAFGQFIDELPFFFRSVFFFPAVYQLVLWSKFCGDWSGGQVKFDYNLYFHQVNQSTMFSFCFYLAPLMRDTLWKWEDEFKMIPVNQILSLELSWIELSPVA